MFSSTQLLAFLPLAALVLAQSGTTPTITSPAALIECEPASIAIAEGLAPYFVSVIPGGNPSGATLEFLPNVAQAGPFTWIVDIASGTNVSFKVTDSAGVVNFSAADVIEAGTSATCVGKDNASSGAASGTSAASGSSTAASAGATATSAAATKSSSTGSSSSSSTGAAAGTTATTGATSASSSESAAGASSTTSAAKTGGAAAGKVVGGTFIATMALGIALLI